LQHLKNLTKLNISMNRLSTVEGLETLPKLITLYVQGNSHFLNISKLSARVSVFVWW